MAPTVFNVDTCTRRSRRRSCARDVASINGGERLSSNSPNSTIAAEGCWSPSAFEPLESSTIKERAWSKGNYKWLTECQGSRGDAIRFDIKGQANYVDLSSKVGVKTQRSKRPRRQTCWWSGEPRRWCDLLPDEAKPLWRKTGRPLDLSTTSGVGALSDPGRAGSERPTFCRDVNSRWSFLKLSFADKGHQSLSGFFTTPKDIRRACNEMFNIAQRPKLVINLFQILVGDTLDMPGEACIELREPSLDRRDGFIISFFVSDIGALTLDVRTEMDQASTRGRLATNTRQRANGNQTAKEIIRWALGIFRWSTPMGANKAGILESGDYLLIFYPRYGKETTFVF
eukprot:Gb_08513 [translate_table: standard]